MKNHFIASVSVIVVWALGFASAAEPKRAIRPEDLADIRGVSDVQISADGKRVAFLVTEPADPEKPQRAGDTNIWIVPADGSDPARSFASSPKKESHPRWSPDGRYLAFLSDRGQPFGEGKEARPQLFLMRTDGGEAEQLTNLKGEVLALKWSPDGKMIAFTVRDPKTDDEQERQRKGYDEVNADHDYKFARLWVVSLAERKVEQVTKQNFEVDDFAWSPDGTELALRVSDTPRKDDLSWHARLVIVRTLTGVVQRTLAQNTSSLRLSLRWSPDGRYISFGQLAATGISELLAIVPAAGGPARLLLRDYPGSPRDAQWEPDSKHLVVECNVRTQDKFFRLDVATETISDLPFGSAVYRPEFSLSQDGRTFAFPNSLGDWPTEVFSWVREDGPHPTAAEKPEGRQLPTRLSSLNPQVAQWRLGTTKEISWKNSKDGQIIFGILVTPPDFKPGRPYPTIVHVHGGPQWAWWNGWLGSWHEWDQLLASNGYVVFLPNPRGSTGQGWRFAEANRDDWGGGDFQDIMSGVDYLVEQKIADPDRLGIGGWSYGGFMTSWTVTQTNRFKAAVVGAAVTNLFSFNGTTDITPSFLRSYFVDLPFRRRTAYDNHSAMTFLQNCKTPSLVLHGDADERVPVTQGWEFYNGLRMLGVPAEMVVYPREHHMFTERPHQVDLLRRVLAWYDKYLKN
ncbi:MAG: S9 family peptidase [Acidobacteria bacterium]|nr:S9 family peptidase [Acidobacteriota bacterium]